SSVSSAATASQPCSRIFAPAPWLGSEAVSLGLSLPSLPVTNTTRPPQSTTNGFIASRKVRVTLSPPVQYRPPQELLEIFAPLSIRSLWTIPSQDRKSTRLNSSHV